MESSALKPAPKALPYIALASGILALSLSALFVRWAEAPGTITTFYRMAFAALFMLPFYLRHQRRAAQRPPWRLLAWTLVGGLFTALDHIFWAVGIQYTTVANATLLNYIAPLWVSVFAFLVWKEKMPRVFWIGLVLTLTGAAVVFGNDILRNPHLSRGDLLATISSLFYAAYFLTTQRARRSLDTMSYIWPVVVVCAVILLGVNLAAGIPLTGYSAQAYLTFLGAALISQVIGYFSVGYALGHLPASVVSPTMILQPVFTALLAIPLAGELLSLPQLLGGLAVLLGIFLVNRR